MEKLVHRKVIKGKAVLIIEGVPNEFHAEEPDEYGYAYTGIRITFGDEEFFIDGCGDCEAVYFSRSKEGLGPYLLEIFKEKGK